MPIKVVGFDIASVNGLARDERSAFWGCRSFACHPDACFLPNSFLTEEKERAQTVRKLFHYQSRAIRLKLHCRDEKSLKSPQGRNRHRVGQSIAKGKVTRVSFASLGEIIDRRRLAGRHPEEHSFFNRFGLGRRGRRRWFFDLFG